jgi:hypothetical protein
VLCCRSKSTDPNLQSTCRGPQFARSGDTSTGRGSVAIDTDDAAETPQVPPGSRRRLRTEEPSVLPEHPLDFRGVARGGQGKHQQDARFDRLEIVAADAPRTAAATADAA